MSPVLLFKCPGPHKAAYGIVYDYCGANTHEEIEHLENRGWSLTLEEAAKKAGPSSIGKVKKNKVKKQKYNPGTPYVAPTDIEVKEDVQVIEAKEYKIEAKAEEVTEVLSLDKNNIPKIRSLLETVGLKQAAKEMKVSWQALSFFRKKHEL